MRKRRQNEVSNIGVKQLNLKDELTKDIGRAELKVFNETSTLLDKKAMEAGLDFKRKLVDTEFRMKLAQDDKDYFK